MPWASTQTKMCAANSSQIHGNDGLFARLKRESRSLDKTVDHKVSTKIIEVSDGLLCRKMAVLYESRTYAVFKHQYRNDLKKTSIFLSQLSTKLRGEALFAD
jgi:hypothetical protein